MATSALKLFLIALFSNSQTETNGQIMSVPVELHTTIDVPCRCPICPESTTGIQWYRSSNPSAFIKDGKALAWWSEGTTGSSQGFGITYDFSMIMYSVNLTNEGLYRCIVTPLGGAAECTHDVKLEIYAKPDTSPVIEYIRQTNGFNVTCSITNVFPMTFPILTTKEGKRTAYNNSDGTYNTTVTHWFPAHEKNTTIQCLYSDVNFNSMSSLRIVDSYIIDQPEQEDAMEENMTYTDFRRTPSGLWMVWIILITEVILFIVIVYAIKTGRVSINPALGTTIRNNTDDLDLHEHHEESSKNDEPAKSTRNLLFGKLSYAVSLTIQITILILLAAYLATGRCSVEAGGTLEGNVTMHHKSNKKSPEMIF